MGPEVLLTGLVPVVYTKLASLIEHQYTKMFGVDIDRQMKSLQSTLSAIDAVLQDAEEKQVESKAIRDWLAKLKDAAYDADDILDEFSLEVKWLENKIHGHMMRKVCNFFSTHNCLLFRRRMGSKMKEIAERLDHIAAERSKFHLRAEIGPAGRLLATRDRSQTHSFVDESEVIGRNADKRNIVEILTSQTGRKGAAVLPIVGIGGLGKTTLAQMVYNEKKVAKHFQQRIWVCVSNDFDLPKIAKSIIESVTERLCEFSDMDVLQRRLRSALNKKRFLLVLDDVWNENPGRWEEFKVLLTFGGEGSAIIVTTRSEIVSSITGTVPTYRLAPLSTDDCWLLFKQRAFVGGLEEPPNLLTRGKRIVDKCGGLPLAAKALGSLMRLKSEEWEWNSVMESDIWELPDDGILPSLRLSYNHLPSYLKQCFTYCALFPKDYEIDIEMLIQLWMANGFIPAEGRMEMEEKGHEIFNELAWRSFFQDIRHSSKQGPGRRHPVIGEPDNPLGFLQDISTEGHPDDGDNMKRTCRMHDLIHDLAQSMVANECCILDKPESISNRRIRHLSVSVEMKPSTIDEVHNPRIIRTLLLLSDKQTRLHLNPSTLPESNLRVLGLHRVYMVGEFPIPMHFMNHLRYLDLSNTNVTSLPEAVCNLFALQTLNLTGCTELRKLPKGIKSMSSLRHLYLHECCRLRFMPQGIGQLRCLRTLTAYAVGNETGCGSIGELKDLNIRNMLHIYGLQNVKNVADAEVANLSSKQGLQHLILDWRQSVSEEALVMGNAEEVLGALEPPRSLKRFKIHSYTGTRFPTWLTGDSMLGRNLVKLVLEHCSRCDHLPQLGRLAFLQILQIGFMVSVKHMGGVEFYGTRGGQECTLFPSLRILGLYVMDNLEEWSGVEGSPSFPRLARLHIIRCPKLRTMPDLPSVQDLYITRSPLLLPSEEFFRSMKSLKRLKMDGCGNLPLLLEKDDDTAGKSLQNLTIRGFHQPMLQSPSPGLWKNLESLHYLNLSECDGLISLPVEVIQGLSSLKHLYIFQCDNLLGSTSPTGEVEGLQLQYLTSLEVLAISSCGKLASIPNDSLNHLTNLRRLELVGCQGMMTLPAFPESLLELNVNGCQNISSLPEDFGGLTTLNYLSIEGLPNFTSLPEGMQGLTALKHLTIFNCPNLVSMPIGLQQRLASLQTLQIDGCPELQRKCVTGGEYWDLISCIEDRKIGC